MLDNAQTSLTGRLWFVNGAAVTGRYVEAEEVRASGDEEMFTFVTDTLKLGATPAIIYDPRVPSEARYYSRGLREPDNYHPLTLDSTEVTVGRIFEAIEKVHRDCLRTPDAQVMAGKLWHKPEKWLPVKDAEAVVQVNLKAGLVGAFPACTVRHEQTMPEGRVDLEIEESDLLDRAKITRHATLELKVLRSFWYTGTAVSDNETREWISSGVDQAAAYRESKGCRLAALCCFDMRTRDNGDSCFDTIRAKAQQLSVALRRWFLYAKAEYLREAMAARPSPERGLADSP
jgi:hypothetical protein